MLITKNIIKSFKSLINTINEKKQYQQITREKLNNKYLIYMFAMSIIPSSIMFGIFMTTNDRSKFLSVGYFIITIIMWMFILVLMEIKRNSSYQKIKDVDSELIIVEFLEKNEHSLMIDIHNCLENNNNISQYKELKRKLEQIKLQCIKKNWKYIVTELPTFLDDLNNEVLKTEITDDDRKKLDNYNTLLKYELNTKEKEINYSL